MKLFPIYESILMTELSVPRKMVVQNVFSRAETIIHHLFYILLYPHEKENVEHWKNEIFDRFIEINTYTIKPNNNRLKKEQYFDILNNYLLDPRNNSQNIIELVKHRKKGLKQKENINVNGFLDLLEKLFDRVSEKISNSSLTIDILNEELDKIIKFSLK